MPNNRVLASLDASAALMGAAGVPTPAMTAPAVCITNAELDAAIGDQVRSGTFAINTSQLREAPMWSGITVAQAIQELGERIPGRMSKGTSSNETNQEGQDHAAAVNALFYAMSGGEYGIPDQNTHRFVGNWGGWELVQE